MEKFILGMDYDDAVGRILGTFSCGARWKSQDEF
jgi:hypothetical protein